MDGTVVSATKPALASKGVWGSIIALAALLIPPILEQLHGLSPDQVKVLGLPTYIVSLAGVALALYGRLSATSTIAGVASTPTPSVLRSLILTAVVVVSVIVGAPLLAACTTPLPPAHVVGLGAPAQLRVQQAVAELQVAQHALLVARDQADAHGVLKGDLRATVFAATRRGGPIDTAVRAAASAGAAVSAATFEAQVAAAYAAITDVRKLIPAG